MTQGIGPSGDPARLDELRRAVTARPHDLVARHNLAVELRAAALFAEGLAEISTAWERGLNVGETALMRAHLLADAGRFDEAVEWYREAARRKPEIVETHVVMASLLPQLGRDDDPLESFRTALAAAPGQGMLWVQALAAAKAGGHFAQLLAWSEQAMRRFGPDSLIRSYEAMALSGLGRDAEALHVVQEVIAGEPGYAAAHVIRAHVLLRVGEPAEAAAAGEEAARLEPQSQSAWALLSVAWRLLDDPREHWLCDYERLVMPLDIGVDPALVHTLEQRHVTAAHPPDQSLRGGTQTRGALFESRDPVVIAAAERIRDTVEAALARLPADPAHPFLGRNTGRVSFPTSWSVRLRSEGRHISHMHPVGWLSSAYYVCLPAEVVDGSGQGCLAFGVPDAALGIELAPRRVVQPAEGRLVLFPSYLWHGTTPFASASPRLTIAFDALPVDNSPPSR